MQIFGNIYTKFKEKFLDTMTKKIVVFYIVFTLLGAILLCLPISAQDGQYLSFIDSLFISASGISTTGLSPVVIKDVLSPFGIVVLAFIIQFGGIGIMMLIAVFFLAAGRRLSFRQRALIMADQNQLRMDSVGKLVINVLGVIFLIEFIGFILLTSGIYFGGYYDTLGESVGQAAFLAISMTTNAGFDISGQSLMQYQGDYFIQSVAMFLMFAGAVGFWPLIEFKEWIIAKFKKQKFRFSILAKVMFFMHIGFWVFGAIIFAGLEFDNFLADKGIISGTFYSLFMSLTTRNAGFATMDVSLLKDATNWISSLFMFVGSSPNSAGGGIRTTTFLLAILAIIAFVKGKDKVVIMKRTVKQETVFRSFIVIFMAIVFVTIAILLVSLNMGDGADFLSVVYEVASAFGTTGLSLGLTSELTTFSKAILILTMFIGRVGVIAGLLFFQSKRTSKTTVEYPEIDMIVG